MITFAVGTLEGMETWFLLLCLKSRGISLLVSFTTPGKLSVMYRLVRATTFDTSHTLNSAHICSVTPLPTILTLWNSQIHIGTTNASDVLTNVETSADKFLGLCTTLGIPNVDHLDQHIRFWQHFNDSRSEARTTLLNIWFSLIIFSTSSVEIYMLVDSKIYGILIIFKKDFD